MLGPLLVSLVAMRRLEILATIIAGLYIHAYGSAKVVVNESRLLSE